MSIYLNVDLDEVIRMKEGNKAPRSFRHRGRQNFPGNNRNNNGNNNTNNTQWSGRLLKKKITKNFQNNRLTFNNRKSENEETKNSVEDWPSENDGDRFDSIRKTNTNRFKSNNSSNYDINEKNYDREDKNERQTGGKYQNERNDRFDRNRLDNQKRNSDNYRADNSQDEDYKKNDRDRSFRNDRNDRSNRLNRRDQNDKKSVRKTIRIDHLNTNVENSEIEELFTPCGPLSSLGIMWENIQPKDEIKCYAIVEFLYESDAQKAIEQFNGAELDGKTLKVDYHNK